MDYPQDVITAASKELFGQGIRVLQGNRFGPTESTHLDKLIAYMRLNGEVKVADMGCGFGEVSVAVSRAIPKAHFYLVNQNEFQLFYCPKTPDRFTELREDMLLTSLSDASVDLVMFNYSLCHVEHEAALIEAARITKPKGKLFVYDYERTSGTDDLSERVLFAKFTNDAQFRKYCEHSGWIDITTIFPGGDDTMMRDAAKNNVLYDEIFTHLRPVIWTAIRA